MKLPRDFSGDKVASLLTRYYGYRLTRSKGSHITLTVTVGNNRHNVTIPKHCDVRVGTLDAIITDVANFFGLTKDARLPLVHCMMPC